VWLIPAERFRTGHEHRIPLSSQVIEILKNIAQVADFVFPGRLKNSAMTTAAGMKLLKSLHPGITQQGFRSTFRDWARNETNYPRDVISHALAPPSGDEAEAAYLRSDLIAKRTALMRDWADFCERA
jgi:integrase